MEKLITGCKPSFISDFNVFSLEKAFKVTVFFPTLRSYEIEEVLITALAAILQSMNY